jgi:soluble lytic murein transglycosylase
MRRRLLLTLLAAGPAAAQGNTAARQALAAAQAQRWGEAEAAAAQADPLIAKMVRWMRLTQRGGAATAAEAVNFIEESPDWPMQDALQRRAEELLTTEADDALVLRLFALRAPRSLAGATRLTQALLAANRRADATAAARSAWGADAPADAIAEPGFLAVAGPLLRPEDHARRFDRLFFTREFEGARRVVPLLDASRQRGAALRLAYAEGGDPDPAGAARDIGATLERARNLRRRDQDAEAASAWAAGVPGQLGLGPEGQRAIWTERQLLSRRMIRLGDPRSAYQLAAQHGQTLPGEPRQEAEFLAGFIALRLLQDPRTAAPHFARLAEGSRSAITQARALYWQGLAARAAGDASTARSRFQAAVAFPVTFYGQMAMLALGEDGAAVTARIRATPTPAVSEAERRAVDGRETTRLVALLSRMGEGRRARPFLLRLEELSATNGERLLVARLATATGRPDNAVWVARRAGASGAMLLQDGWPTPFPPPAGGAEPALVFAIARQESNFDPEAVSSANARGVMQLLPATAQSVARRIGVAHNVAWLTSDPAHNLRLGAHYIDERLGRFEGALPLALAAYNAGSGRVDEWVVQYGDPRAGGRPMLDWMELIPFGETRNYVQRVIENLAVYRAIDPRSAAEPHPMSRWTP